VTRRGWAALVGLYVLVVAVGAFGYLYPPVRLTAATVAAEVFGRFYPLQYQSYLKNAESATNYSKLDGSPYLKVVYKEHGFSLEFNSTRGHVYSLEDLLATARGKGPACLVCKSAEAQQAIASFSGRTPTFAELTAKIKQPVTCANCHNPTDMSLRLTNPALAQALAETDPAAAQDPKRMRSLVCAQCHIEYYCPPAVAQPVLAWGGGLDPAAIEAEYAKLGIVDWTHPLAGTPLLKLQHPEYETFQGSVHQKLGLNCADCHMPRVTEGGKTFTSHLWTSPFEHLQQSCASCHADLPGIKARAQGGQAAVATKARQVGEALADLAGKFPGAAEGERLEQAKQLYAKAHYRWDWVFCENSVGFHNFALTDRLLGEALTYIAEARALLGVR
jgi:nitrite reductase (cytochrome c-552)